MVKRQSRVSQFGGIIPLLLVSGCDDPVGDAKARLEIVKAQPGVSSREVCAAERKVADAYLEAKDAKGYSDAKLFADVTCLNAQLDRSRYGGDAPYRDEDRVALDRIEPDNLDEITDTAAHP
ncbi:hypothetical protein [Sphingomonas sp.]|jgi:hypothetical protein|uniref:hypothetical protein n=1 Tax=Sphingomonas sp. TaxID=28214 RepID=UPI00261BB989|nr:hypothetical protein [Sphingomonas sp.]MDF2603490.1 hypothetical protein [Sphingomonas sp.]